MGDEITSIAELKKAVEKLNWCEIGFCARQVILKFINEFEASVRERVKPKNFFGNKHPAKCSCTLCCIAKQILGGE